MIDRTRRLLFRRFVWGVVWAGSRAGGWCMLSAAIRGKCASGAAAKLERNRGPPPARRQPAVLLRPPVRGACAQRRRHRRRRQKRCVIEAAGLRRGGRAGESKGAAETRQGVGERKGGVEKKGGLGERGYLAAPAVGDDGGLRALRGKKRGRKTCTCNGRRRGEKKQVNREGGWAGGGGKKRKGEGAKKQVSV